MRRPALRRGGNVAAGLQPVAGLVGECGRHPRQRRHSRHPRYARDRQPSPGADPTQAAAVSVGPGARSDPGQDRESSQERRVHRLLRSCRDRDKLQHGCRTASGHRGRGAGADGRVEKLRCHRRAAQEYADQDHRRHLQDDPARGMRRPRGRLAREHALPGRRQRRCRKLELCPCAGRGMGDQRQPLRPRRQCRQRLHKSDQSDRGFDSDIAHEGQRFQ